MQWTDQIRRIKIILVMAAILIAVASLVVSHALTKDLENQERTRMEVWAEAMRTLNNADENTDLNLVLKVLNENNTIPVVVMDKHGDLCRQSAGCCHTWPVVFSFGQCHPHYPRPQAP